MPYNRERKSSMADLMARVPVNRGSLLTSIENLLKTIESSESAVMIPTLLRDKCEFDAWELLFVAKILKASILGHSDLVEFYMNHINHQKSQLAAAAASASQPTTPTVRQASSPSLSPATSQPAPSMTATPAATTNGHTTTTTATNGSAMSSLSSSASSISSQTSSGTTTAPSSSSTGWMTASSQQQQQQQPQQPQQQDRSASSSLSSSTSSSSNSSSMATAATPTATNGLSTPEHDIELAVLARTLLTPSMSSPANLIQRQPQPPSLLQLTTTNNHINSRLTSSGAIVEQPASSTMQPISKSPTGGVNGASNGFEMGSGALSISTNQPAPPPPPQQQQSPAAPSSAGIVHHHHHQGYEQQLKSSRSAGCLFRNQSGASSPRTPTTPQFLLAQAETLADGGSQLAGDPSMPVKLLLQIEQLKSSIVYVTDQLENVVELYKKSIDNLV